MAHSPSSKQPVVTRFAPSPTGYLHIGGARTALFNWLFARHTGGTFLLRIEDTDLKRSTPEATKAILDGLSWLDLNPDLPPVYQSRGIEAHKSAAYALVENGSAYKCYATEAEVEALRQTSRDAGHAFRSPYRDAKTPPSEDAPYVVRFRVPDGETTIVDHVQGDVTWQNQTFDDLVLLRADGTPTYMLAVVVDDHDMGITHVIRGDDHLINAGRQTQIYQAMGWDVPEWAHVPLIHGPDGKKLSKRHGSLAVGEYQGMGYLPAGLRNYLLRLGWSHGDEELFTDDEAIAAFTLGGINASPGRLDFDKMDFVNGHHLAHTDDKFLMTELTPFLVDKLGRTASPEEMARILTAMPTLKTRAKTLVELAEQAEFLCLTLPLQYTGKTKKSLRPDAKNVLQDLQTRLSTVKDTEWTAETLKNSLDDYAQDKGVGFGKVGMPLRATLTAGRPSPDLALVLEYLGRKETLARLEHCITAYPV